MLGWYSPAHGRLEPSPTAVFTKRGREGAFVTAVELGFEVERRYAVAVEPEVIRIVASESDGGSSRRSWKLLVQRREPYAVSTSAG